MGFAMCVLNCPAVFDTDDTSTVVIKRSFTDKELADVQMAVESCPTGALSIEWT
jgi:ferredoxin